MLSIKQFVFNPFDENTYIVADSASGDAIVVDPGMSTPAEMERFRKYVADKDLTLREVVLTHMHLDHCFGANGVARDYDVPIAASAADADLGASIAAQAARFGMSIPDAEAVVAGVILSDGDRIAVGSETLEVIAVPGHSRGGIALYSSEGKVVLTGDSLFRRSIGRTDLPGGDARTLVDAVRRRLLSLPSDTLVLPGHGPSTTIGEERLGNPFI